MIEPALRPPPHKGAYIFPNLLTAGNLFAGFYAIVTAMTQVQRWGPGASVMGDQQAWREAREAVESLMERYHGRPVVPGR